MDDVIKALGWRVGPKSRLALSLILPVGTWSMLLLGYAFQQWAGVDPLLFHALWAVPWLVWLRYVFPKHPAKVARKGVPLPYREGFYRHVVPGVCWNFAQMSRPGLYGLLGHGDDATLPHLFAGGALLVVGGTFIALGLRGIGVSGTMFVPEYRAAPPKLVSTGVFGIVRHPLYVGGVTASVGFGLVFASDLTIAMGLMNVALLPPYVALENMRCNQLFGRSYESYSREVGACFPRVRSRLKGSTPRASSRRG